MAKRYFFNGIDVAVQDGDDIHVFSLMALEQTGKKFILLPAPVKAISKRIVKLGDNYTEIEVPEKMKKAIDEAIAKYGEDKSDEFEFYTELPKITTASSVITPAGADKSKIIKL